MPKSKRNKQIELAKTKKRGIEWKKQLFEQVRSCVDSYTNVFVFSISDMRNSKMKNVREQWKHSKFFIGKNKIMAMALGRSAEEEYKPNLHKIGQEIKGERGLLFSNKSTEEVLSWFRSYSEGDYARTGNVSTENVLLPAGPLPMFPHNLEPYLRQLGLPTSLVKGEIHLVKEHEVCKAGEPLTAESARILKLLGYEMAEFHITIECVWSQDGTFMKFTDNSEPDSKENVKKGKKKSVEKKTTGTMESLDEDMQVSKEDMKKEKETSLDKNTKEKLDSADDDIKFSLPELDVEEDMEVELDKNLDELKEGNDSFEDTNEANCPLTTVSNALVTSTSTPKAKNESLENSNEVKISVIEEINIDEEPSSILIKETPNVEKKRPVLNNTPNGTPKSKNESSKNSNEVEINAIEEIVNIDEKPSSMLMEGTPNVEKKRPVPKSTHKNKAKRESLPKTPDANTSQESPIFRQLRNRSVKVSRKRRK